MTLMDVLIASLIISHSFWGLFFIDVPLTVHYASSVKHWKDFSISGSGYDDREAFKIVEDFLCAQVILHQTGKSSTCNSLWLLTVPLSCYIQFTFIKWRKILKLKETEFLHIYSQYKTLLPTLNVCKKSSKVEVLLKEQNSILYTLISEYRIQSLAESIKVGLMSRRTLVKRNGFRVVAETDL